MPVFMLQIIKYKSLTETVQTLVLQTNKPTSISLYSLESAAPLVWKEPGASAKFASQSSSWFYTHATPVKTFYRQIIGPGFRVYSVWLFASLDAGRDCEM